MNRVTLKLIRRIVNTDAVRTESDLVTVKTDLAEPVNTPAVSNTDPARRECMRADPESHPAAACGFRHKVKSAYQWNQ